MIDEKDTCVFKYINQRGNGFIIWDGEIKSSWVSKDGRTLTIPWEAYEKDFESSKNASQPIAILVALRTRGGKESAKTQLHRARAYFDTWLEAHPDYADDFNKILWGKV